ncbi:hypothetical protein V2J88_07160 [Pseudomonas alliivorans]|nr:hypothetical protein [Pseudomonas alliivorans]
MSAILYVKQNVFKETTGRYRRKPLQIIEDAMGHFLHFLRIEQDTLADISATGASPSPSNCMTPAT